MKIVFFGTPKYCLPILNAINKRFKNKKESPFVAIVTQKPKPAGRKKHLTYSPVDTWAHKKNIPVLYSAKEIVEEKIKADMGILVAYGEILSKKVINYFPFGILNIHPSLLPKFKGTSPLQAAIVSGEKITGASIIKIDEKIDHGPIVAQFKEEIRENDNYKTLGERIFKKSTVVLTDLLKPYLANKISLKKQDDQKATSYSTLLIKEHGYIPPKFIKAAMEGNVAQKEWIIPFIRDYSIEANPYTIYNYIRAVSPWPGVWTEIQIKSSEKKKRIKILDAEVVNGKLKPLNVQIEGKNPVTWKELTLGYPDFTFS